MSINPPLLNKTSLISPLVVLSNNYPHPQLGIALSFVSRSAPVITVNLFHIENILWSKNNSIISIAKIWTFIMCGYICWYDIFQALEMCQMKKQTFLSTSLPSLDNALHGGLTSGTITEVIAKYKYISFSIVK